METGSFGSYTTFTTTGTEVEVAFVPAKLPIWAFCAGGAALLVLGLLLGGRLTVVSAAGVLDLLYLAFICGAGYVIWALLMKNNPVSRIAIFGFVNPVVNVLLSALLNGEPLFRWQYMGALVLVCVGIWLVNKAPKKEGV